MWETINKEWQAKAAIVILTLLTVWFFLNPLMQGQNAKRFFGDFSSIYAIMALWGGIWGIDISRKWGFLKSLMGKAILMFSLGLFAQVLGQIIYAYFSFYKNVETPYPSLGDVGYFGSIPLYILGVIFLARASGVTIKLKAFKNKLQAIIIPLIVLFIGYLFFLQGYVFDWSDPVKVFLDFGYPLGEAIYLSLAILTYFLSRGILGGVMKNKILFILFALSIQFFADYTFLYQSSKGLWVSGGIGDYIYLLSYFLMTMGLLQLGTTFAKLKRS